MNQLSNLDNNLLSMNQHWWENQGFNYNSKTFTWVKYYSKTKLIFYSDRVDLLTIRNWDKCKQYIAQHPTKHEFFQAIELCDLNI